MPLTEYNVPLSSNPIEPVGPIKISPNEVTTYPGKLKLPDKNKSRHGFNSEPKS